MTLEEILKALESAGIPFAYHMWPIDGAPPLPYGVYAFLSDKVFYADGKPYYISGQINVELYTDGKSPETESRLERAMDAAKILWTKQEIHLEEEEMIEILYECEV